MIDSDNIYRYLGLAIVVILAILFVMRCMRMQLNVIEGMFGSSNNNNNNNNSSNNNNSNNNNSSSFFGSSNNNNNNNNSSSFFGSSNNNNNDNNNNNGNNNGNSSSFFGSSNNNNNNNGNNNNNNNDPQAQAIEQIADAVKTNGDKIEDALLLNKYTSSYEDIIINLEAVISDTMLSSLKPLAEQISKDPTSATNLAAMSSLNNLNTFRSTLDDMMTALDKKSSLTSGASNFFGGN